jgi:hypothetical protein
MRRRPGESIASAWAGLNASLALLLGSAARTTALQSLALALPTGWTMDALHDVSFGMRRAAKACSVDAARRAGRCAAQHGALIVRIARSHESDRGRAEELVQDIHVAIWQALPKFAASPMCGPHRARRAKSCDHSCDAKRAGRVRRRSRTSSTFYRAMPSAPRTRPRSRRRAGASSAPSASCRSRCGSP